MSDDFNERFRGYSKRFGNSWGMNWRAYMIKRAEKARAILDDYFDKHENEDYSILEIGCASGDFTNHILDRKSSKCRYVGGDISEDAIRICRESYHDINNADFMIVELPYIELDEQFDFVICMDVIHYFKPDHYKKCFENIQSLIKKDGRVLVQVPLGYSDEKSLIDSFSKTFDLKTMEYVYGQLWYDLIEKWLQPLVQVTYIENHKNALYRFCGWIGYQLLSCKWLVGFVFKINKVIFKHKRSHIILVGVANNS